ncbi:hypothetical protein Bbelb_306940 [Branchiostoma belcheri]|nr:hypothetical protein Bbelb_306940 [Branchiostoma belcheri]
MVRLVGNLGRACRKAGEYTKSIQYYERVLGINKGIHGEEATHPSIVNSLSNLAAVYEDFGDHAKAIELYQDVLHRVQTVQGANKTHPDILKLLNNLETVYTKVGDQEKANSYRDQARALQKSTAENETHRGDTDSTGHKELR